jgi:hypothetical protein
VRQFVRGVGGAEDLLVLEDRFAAQEVVEQPLGVVLVVLEDVVQVDVEVSRRVDVDPSSRIRLLVFV